MPDSDDTEETESTTPESDDAEDVTSESAEGDEPSSDEVEDAEVGEVEDETAEEAGEEAESPEEGDEVSDGAVDEEDIETAGAKEDDEEVEAEDEEDEQVEAAEGEGADSEELEEIETAMAEGGDADEERPQDDEEEPPSQPVVKSEGRFYGTGRRKESVARVWIESGSGEVTINDTSLEAYFSNRPKWTEAVRAPLECVGMGDQVDVWATADGGGLTGQADALQLGVARALVEMDENARYWLRPEGHLTRDDREVERKKINQPGARAKSQVSKR